jgi:hypothetical protein
VEIHSAKYVVHDRFQVRKRQLSSGQMTKPYKFIGFDDSYGPKPYKFIGFGDSYGPKPYKFIGFGDSYGGFWILFFDGGIENVTKRH